MYIKTVVIKCTYFFEQRYIILQKTFIYIFSIKISKLVN